MKGWTLILFSKDSDCCLSVPRKPIVLSNLAIQKGTRVLISLWDSLMFGRVPGTRPNTSESHSEISTRVPFCIADCALGGPQAAQARHERRALGT